MRFAMLAGAVICFTAAGAVESERPSVARNVSPHSDPYIVEVQELLREERVYPGEPTGLADASTVAAIRRYQIVHGLRVTGRLDDATLTAMRLPPAPPPAHVVREDREFLRDLASWKAPLAPPQSQSPSKTRSRKHRQEETEPQTRPAEEPNRAVERSALAETVTSNASVPAIDEIPPALEERHSRSDRGDAATSHHRHDLRKGRRHWR